MPTFLGDGAWLWAALGSIILILVLVQGFRVNSQMHGGGKNGNNGNNGNNNKNNGSGNTPS